jgi:hypothetical protein
MKRLYVSKNALQSLIEMKEKILDIAGNFIYTPATNENLTYMKSLIDMIIEEYNLIFSIHNFKAYSSLDFNATDINGGICFKELSTGEKVFLEVLS